KLGPMNTLKTITWDHTNVYKGFSDGQIQEDIKSIESTTERLRTKVAGFEELISSADRLERTQWDQIQPLAKKLYREYLDAKILTNTLSQYANMALSVNT